MNSTFGCSRDEGRRYFLLFGALLSLFCCRVLGQVLVAFYNVSFLPPMQEWQSGLLPYPVLLGCQIAIIALLGKVCFDFARRRGLFVTPNPKLGSVLNKFGSVYLGSMMLRYIIRMSMLPDERWFGGCIPIVFHCVLASFVLLLAYYHSKSGRIGSGTAAQ